METNKYILPNMYNGIENNLQIFNTFKNFIYFQGVQGSYPFSIMNGNYNNNNYENIAMFPQIEKMLEDYGPLSSSMVIMDCANLFLTEKDYYDSFNKVMFEEFSNKTNHYFEIADKKLADYLINRYPNIQLIIHQNYTMYHTEEEIQIFINQYKKNIKGIIITPKQECKNIDNVFKIYLIPLSLCQFCASHSLCLKNENYSTLDYSEISYFATCKSRKLLSISEIFNCVKKASEETELIMFDTCLKKYEINEIQLIIGVLKEVLQHVKI